MTKLAHQTQTLEITDKDHIYINGNLYQQEQALQFLGHMHVFRMIDDVTFSEWRKEIAG